MNTKVLGKDYIPSKFKVIGKENYRRGCPTAVWWLPQPLPSLLHWPGQDKMKIACLEAFHQRSPAWFVKCLEKSDETT